MTIADGAGPPAWCTGSDLRRFFFGGLAALERCAQAVDRLNIFPVPDGDTGTNLAATVKQAARAAETCASDELSTVAHALAIAALHAARGNSGAIFAQLCAGLSAAFEGRQRADATAWATAWTTAADAARRSVANPVEGTILTVARDAAAAARETAAAGGTVLTVWQAMAEAAEATVARTPQMLAVLEAAHVVDAGGLGLALFLRGGVTAFSGAPLPDPSDLMRPSAATRRVIEEADFPRYCTQFLLLGAGSERRTLAAQFRPYGESLDVVTIDADDPRTGVQIHVHTDDPDTVVAYAATLGTVSGVRIEDMQQQRSRLLAGADEPQHVALVAVVSGPGMRRLFESLYGVAAVVERDGRAAPTAEQLRAAVATVPARDVLLLPNDEHLLACPPTATAATAASQKRVVVIPTRNMPEGVAAALAFNAGVSLDTNAHTMGTAAETLRTVSVTSVEDQDGRRVLAADDRRRLAMGEDLPETAEAGVTAAAAPDHVPLFTLYYGAGVSPAQAADVARRLERRFPAAEVEIVDGGQPECLLWIAWEGYASSDRH